MNVARHGQSFALDGREADVALVAESAQFDAWLARMDRRFRIRRIEVQAADTRFHGGLLFAKLKADVTDPDGRTIPGSVFLRGDAAAVLIVLRDGPRAWALLTVQPRFPVGVFDSVEIPAGMCDNQGDFIGTAAREVQEETGISVRGADLKLLGEFAPSGGGSDERIQLFLYERDATADEITSLQGKLTGMHAEHERMHLLLVPLEELPRHTRDIKALLAYGCYRLWQPRAAPQRG